MSQDSPSRMNRARSSTDVHLAKRPCYALPHVMSPPLSPPPTSPLPLPPISPSPISSLYSDTSLLRPVRTQTSLSTLQSGPIGPSELLRKSFKHSETKPNNSVRLQSPFISPIGASLHPGFRVTHNLPIVQQTRNEHSTSAKLVKRDRTTSASQRHTRWSEAACNAAVPISDALAGVPPPVPPKSKKRRSKRPPRKAVARSALYIPSPSRSKESLEIKAISSLGAIQAGAPLHEELVTSLPELPYSMIWTSKMDRRLGFQRKGKEKAFEPFVAWTIPSACPNFPSCPGIAEKRVTFRAVTNLEKSCTGDQIGTKVRKTAQSASELWSAPQVPAIRRRKYVWICVTVVFVLMAVGGILTGIIWRLTRV